ncbi:hypothetical protein [Bradyrhizobium sp.]|uniref:hypothetical protein n=1 Tax=Bradyrhizobium sp. TaxID=376 RepID=UPI002BB3C5A4|nr:hypothetical protein [Bradyrhizobium sp.]HMM87964.1 hypothetical protein [Bradyrhizobium sp.]
MPSMGSGDSSSGRTDCCATRAANGSADNRAGRGAARRLCDNFSVNRRCRNSNQEQKRQRFLHFLHLFVVRADRRFGQHQGAAPASSRASELKLDQHTAFVFKGRPTKP